MAAIPGATNIMIISGFLFTIGVVLALLVILFFIACCQEEL